MVGWAKPPGRANARPMTGSAYPPFSSRLGCMVGTAQTRLCPPYETTSVDNSAAPSGTVVIYGPHAFFPDNVEYQFGAPAHRHRRQIPQIGAAGRAVPAGNQM